MKFTLSNRELAELNQCPPPEFPKYTTQLMNLANQNGQGTRPNVVGQMSELIVNFHADTPSPSVEAWEAWYTAHHPDALETATDRVYAQILHLREALPLIDRAMVRDWVQDLLISKTYNGLCIQEAVLAALAARLNQPFRRSVPHEEAQGIDGFIGDLPYSVKPDTYSSKQMLSEKLPIRIVTYSKSKSGLRITCPDF